MKSSKAGLGEYYIDFRLRFEENFLRLESRLAIMQTVAMMSSSNFDPWISYLQYFQGLKSP